MAWFWFDTSAMLIMLVFGGFGLIPMLFLLIGIASNRWAPGWAVFGPGIALILAGYCPDPGRVVVGLACAVGAGVVSVARITPAGAVCAWGCAQFGSTTSQAGGVPAVGAGRNVDARRPFAGVSWPRINTPRMQRAPRVAWSETETRQSAATAPAGARTGTQSRAARVLAATSLLNLPRPGRVPAGGFFRGLA